MIERANSPQPLAAFPTDDRSRRARRLLILVLVCFAFVRAMPVFNDLWLDEVWSLWHVGQLRSLGEIFSRFRYDNNHPLNSLWMYLLVPSQADWTYRLLAWVGGVLGLLLAGPIARLQWQRLQSNAAARSADVAAWIATVLSGSSYVLTLYSSEARGYGPLIGLAMLATFALFRGTLNSSHPQPATLVPPWITYGFACFLGLLAHVVMCQVIIAGIVFTAAHAIAGRSTARAFVGTIAKWHAVPITFAVFYYATFLRHLEIVGGPENRLASVVGDLASYTLGIPAKLGLFVGLPALVILLVAGFVLVARASRPLALFYFVALLAVPAAGLIVGRLGILFPRYFIIDAMLVPVLAAQIGAACWTSNRFHRHAVVAAGILIVVGNAVHVGQLLRHGRGEYSDALRYIATHTPEGNITVCSDHDGRNVLLVYHHSPRVIGSRKLEYLPANTQPREGAQWLLMHRLEGMPEPEPVLADDRGNPYRFEQRFTHAPLSGWDWFLYRNVRLLP